MMPIDSSIYARFAPQVKSVQDYENEYMRGQANQLALLGAKGEYQDKQRARQEAEALKGVVSGFGQDQTANYQALLRGGFLKPAQDYQKNALDVGKTQAETDKARAAADKDRLVSQKTRMETILNAASSARDPGSYAQVRNMLSMQGFDVSSIPEQYDPAFVENARRSAMTEVQRLDQEWKAKGYDLDVFRAAEAARHNKTTEGLTAQGQQITLRGQNMTDARARESIAATRETGGKAPAGYRYKADGTLEYIPGGPADPNSAKKAAPTEFQGKSATFGSRAEEADKILTELTGKYSPAAVASKQAVGRTPLIGGALEAGANVAMSKDSQKAEQAMRNFVNAVLRQESGAVISQPEFENAAKQYFPQPGDSKEVIAQKAANRRTVIEGFRKNAAGTMGHGGASGSFDAGTTKVVNFSDLK